MDYELAYDLTIEVDREVVFVVSDDRHRKVRLLITETQTDGDTVSFVGNSLGSSVREIKAAKRDEPPIVVGGTMTQVDGAWRAELTKV